MRGLSAAITIAAVASTAHADVKGACFDAAEQAQTLKADHDLLRARTQLIACTADDCPDQVKHDCAQWLGEVDAAMPTFSIHARDARGKDVIGVRVFLDGALVTESLGGTPVQANPGAHKLRIETPAGAAYDVEVLLVEAQKGRIIEAAFAVDLNVDGTAATPATDSTAPLPSRQSSRHVRTSTVVATGCGIRASQRSPPRVPSRSSAKTPTTT